MERQIGPGRERRDEDEDEDEDSEAKGERGTQTERIVKDGSVTGVTGLQGWGRPRPRRRRMERGGTRFRRGWQEGEDEQGGESGTWGTSEEEGGRCWGTWRGSEG